MARVGRCKLYFCVPPTRKQLTERISAHISHQTNAGGSAPGRILALDLGTKRVGVAVSDELRLTVRPLPPLFRANWKQFVRAVSELRERFDARVIVIGLPLRLDGSRGDAAEVALRAARNLELSIDVPVHVQDERLTSHAAEETLRDAGCTGRQIRERVDSEAATLILRDFISQHEE